MSQTAMTTCRREACYAPDTTCVLGLDPCHHFSGAEHEPAGDADLDGQRLPWSGLALGTSDLPAVAALGRVHLVALVGAAGSGKTTCLAAHWLAARRGDGRYGRQFAGSYTLAGWHQISRHLQWGGDGQLGFPPHTTVVNNRVPSLLHAAFFDAGAVRHVVFADVPGEWYRAWAFDVHAVVGATWIADNADSFVLLADSKALSGAERGEARGNYSALARRVASVRGDRPLVAVRTKADVEVPQPVREHVESLNRDLFDVDTVTVSVQEVAGGSLTDVIDAGVAATLAPRLVAAAGAPSGADPFLRFRSPAGGP
ncbi:MAG TPA: hypothetical protein VFD59_04645 [Nocardioidaceae bacterium]|nr:hypothetical protein [Nocardioidaceae bacterium]